MTDGEVDDAQRPWRDHEQEFPGSPKAVPWLSMEIFRGCARLALYMIT
jgi:hypothetical protein